MNVYLKKLSLLTCASLFAQSLSAHTDCRLEQSATAKTITLFSHGMLDTGSNQIKGYLPVEGNKDARCIIQKPYAYFNYDDACDPKCGIKLCKFWHCSFGQHNDQATIARVYDDLTKKFPEDSYVLAGVSRGASVIWSFVANKKPTQVKALILESPFDHIQTSLEAAAHHVPALINCWLTRRLAQDLLRNIALKSKADALQPIDVANQIPLGLPMLIVCSLEDKLVPAQSSYRLYQALRARGHKDLYILILAKGSHAKLLRGADGQRYEAVVHAFYKKYELPYDQQKAELGKDLLPLCQPTDAKSGCGF
ncbi:MAG: prolyl oligopeptidase family serine peptidase [Epsilonproteobacteria bacterium]|nr:prolyl oligopeptidase family serine peptidase [Campylobacterota bacterium]